MRSNDNSNNNQRIEKSKDKTGGGSPPSMAMEDSEMMEAGKLAASAAIASSKLSNAQNFRHPKLRNISTFLMTK